MQPLFGYTLLLTSLGLKEGTCFVGVCRLHGRVQKYTQHIGPEICMIVELEEFLA
jgi:hypothetical protein